MPVSASLSSRFSGGECPSLLRSNIIFEDADNVMSDGDAMIAEVEKRSGRRRSRSGKWRIKPGRWSRRSRKQQRRLKTKPQNRKRTSGDLEWRTCGRRRRTCRRRRRTCGRRQRCCWRPKCRLPVNRKNPPFLGGPQAPMNSWKCVKAMWSSHDMSSSVARRIYSRPFVSFNLRSTEVTPSSAC